MPSIAIELDPNLQPPKPQTNYSTLIWVPPASAANQWSGYLDATQSGGFVLTGGDFDPANCGLGAALCTYAQIVAYLIDDGGAAPSIISVGVSKGPDFEFHGAVDGLRFNGKVYDFEEHRVVVRDA